MILEMLMVLKSVFIFVGVVYPKFMPKILFQDVVWIAYIWTALYVTGFLFFINIFFVFSHP